MQTRNKIYFASDFHLGAPNNVESIQREKKICEWLEKIKNEAKEIYLLGDLFDFWFEYKKVIPKGFERLKGKLAQLTDSGIKIHLFVGNHDLWTFGYLENEIGLKIYKESKIIKLNGKKFYLSHGDGLGSGNKIYKFLKFIYSNKICQFLFSLIPSNIGISLAQFLSKQSRIKQNPSNEKLGETYLTNYCKKQLEKHHIDFFIFGHIHQPKKILISHNSSYVNLGDWVTHFSYAELDGENLLLKNF